MENNPVFKILSKILFGPIIIFGLYVQFHGDYGPGGGFQAGVIVAAAFIFYAMIFGLEEGRKLFPKNLNYILMSIGVLLYGFVGIVSTFLGGKYLDYNVFSASPASGQHIGILLVELGVGITVTTVMLALFHAFSGFKVSK
tara:strand:- start:83 stop:505 length:423 start_codon:yes stop_codon:yes gene_type:complete